jgi:hypothetical protein
MEMEQIMARLPAEIRTTRQALTADHELLKDEMVARIW